MSGESKPDDGGRIPPLADPRFHLTLRRWSLLVAAVDEAWAAVLAVERGMKGLAFDAAEARQGEYDR